MGPTTDQPARDDRTEDSRSPQLLEPPATMEAATHRRRRNEPPPPASPSREQMASADALAEELHPRERLISAGPQALSAAELLAAVFGGEPARSLELAKRILSGYGSLAALRRASYHDLTRSGVPSLSHARACALLATVELGKRLAEARSPDPIVIRCPQDVHELVAERMRDLDREHFVAVLLDTKNQVLATPTVSVGTALSAPVHPREVFRPAIKASAAALILVHNHPSGQPEPSRDDRAVTERLASVGETVGIEVTDHVIVAGDRWVSLKERGVL